jgi:uncharacterized cupredoxin-like copper-binding protein
VVAASPAVGQPVTAQAASQTVTVTAVDFRFRLSSTSVRTGTVVFRLENKGKLNHDFKINGVKTPAIRPGKSATLRVTFRRSGSYYYLCTVPGHAALGMKGHLRVT